MRTRPPAEELARWALGVVTLLLLASMGGGFLALPLLVPAHVWAARRSGRTGRLGWSILPAASAAMLSWAGLYVVVGEAKPMIWLLPTLVLGGCWALVVRVASPPPPHPGDVPGCAVGAG